MTGWNLPPGCSESDIPGNRDIDMAWEKWFNDPTNYTEYCTDCDEWAYCPMRKEEREYDCRYLNNSFDEWYYNERKYQ